MQTKARKSTKPVSRSVVAAEALANAKAERSLANYPAIIEGFAERGIPINEILPRENVFTYHAWRALGRQVRKGEHGVKVVTWINAKGEASEAVSEEAKAAGFRFCRSVAVFHISQTEPVAIH